jgi:hypothetical protein
MKFRKQMAMGDISGSVLSFVGSGFALVVLNTR